MFREAKRKKGRRAEVGELCQKKKKKKRKKRRELDKFKRVVATERRCQDWKANIVLFDVWVKFYKYLSAYRHVSYSNGRALELAETSSFDDSGCICMDVVRTLL